MDSEVPHQLKVYESTRRHDLTAHRAAARRDLYGTGRPPMFSGAVPP